MSPLPYRPHPLLRNGHLQTLMVGLHNGVLPAYNAERTILSLPDEESLVIHREKGPSLARSAPVVILVHGLGGDHRSAYLQRLAPALRLIGAEVWRVDLRGCGDGSQYAWRPANAGRSEDLAAVFAHAAQLHRSSEIYIVGFSLSGNILLKMLGELAAGVHPSSNLLPRLTAALAIAPPIDLHDCANNMERLSRRLYTYYYLKNLYAQVNAKQALWEQWRARPTEPRAKTLREFDARFTAPMSGYRDTDDYYSSASAMHWLEHIVTPTTILVDRDDPIVTARSFEKARFHQQSTQLVFTRYGGHMGYFGLDERGQLIRWMEYFVMHFLKTQRNKPDVDSF